MRVSETYKVAPQYIDIGTTDSRGRDIGTNIYRAIRVVSGEENPRWLEKNGFSAGDTAYALRVHATRKAPGVAPREYGASQPVQYFKSVEGRELAVIKYLKGARNRAKALSPE